VIVGDELQSGAVSSCSCGRGRCFAGALQVEFAAHDRGLNASREWLECQQLLAAVVTMLIELVN
jgi:hypothetical protein